MKVIIFGASGIIGQHMRLCVPPGIEPVWVRSHEDVLHHGVDANDFDAVVRLFQEERPHAVVNLAGESNPDTVERSPERYRFVNAEFPGQLIGYCHRQNIHLVHVSTQAVFSGENPPYRPESPKNAVNEYGRQKTEAEDRIRQFSSGWAIIRPTFVLGVRPMPAIGRQNPIEQMIEGQKNQVADRKFSVSLAEGVASYLWEAAIDRIEGIIHVGSMTVSRYDIASMIGDDVNHVSHADFPGIAPRPGDTTYRFEGSKQVWAGADALYHAIGDLRCAYDSRITIKLPQRARELSIFTGAPETECAKRLALGFGILHNEVTADFHHFAPKNDHDLLEWYRNTDAYLWELSAYHADQGFSYDIMCGNVSEALKAHGANQVMCLGDGIGDMTLRLMKDGLAAVYHDLGGSRTAKFAIARIWMYLGKTPAACMNPLWEPPIVKPDSLDAICAFDFLEHMTDVPAWVKMIHTSLRPGGLLFAQNAFACGSGDDGPMPMHLARNDRFEKDWDPMLAEMGFVQMSSNWYRKGPATELKPEPMASNVAV